jgi:hypothetical protein
MEMELSKIFKFGTGRIDFHSRSTADVKSPHCSDGQEWGPASIITRDMGRNVVRSNLLFETNKVVLLLFLQTLFSLERS